MRSSSRTKGEGGSLPAALALAALVVLTMTACLAAQGSAKTEAPPPGAVEVRFADDSTMKMVLRDERLELETPYGKLLIPVSDIQRIEFGFRITDEVRRRVAAAVADLGHAEFRRRQAATAELLALKEKAYPAVLQIAHGKDQEAARRAEQLLEKIRAAVPAEVLELPTYDVVVTEHSRIAGRLTAALLRVHTVPFGEQQVKLSDLRSLRSQAAADTAAVPEALPDPGTLVGFQNQVGTRLAFKVTAPLPAPGGLRMAVYGTDIYTMDSALALAAVHAGVLQPGQTGVVRVTILGPQAAFQGSSRHGVLSSPYGAYPGFRVEAAKAAGGKR
jgi:LCCL domain